jgi:hypothetical protein
MNRTLRALFVVIAVLAAFSGCLSVGKPRGPVDAFVFSAGANPRLGQDAPGSLNMRTDPLEISVVVPPGTDKSRLVATFSLNAEATITVISSGQRVVQENGATANDFSAPVLYAIEVVKEKKPWRYKVTVREAETNARLAQLGFPEGSVLTPAFNPQVKSYTVVVPFATRQLRVSARAESQFLKSITFDGVAAGGASATGNVDFSTGQQRSVLIETLAEDGASRDRYTLTVRRGEPDRNSLLGSLEAVEGALAPAFSPQRTEYSLQVPYSATRVVLRARSQSGLAALSLSTIAASQGSQERAVLQTRGNLEDASGASVEFIGLDWLPLIVTVTAEDGSRREYLVEVARAEPDRNNALASLAVTGAALTPAFAPGNRSYTVRVPYATRQLAVIAQPQSPVARAVLELVAAPQGTPAIQGALGSPEGALVAFPTGERMSLAVAVTAEDGSARSYLLEVRRQPPERNADLGILTPSAGTLRPAFNARTVSYSLRLPATVETVTFTLATASAVATVRVEPPASLSGGTLSVPVAAGQSLELNILVTAEDGTQRLYRVGITREGPAGGDTGGDTGGQTGGQTGNTRLALLQFAGAQPGAPGAQLAPTFNPAVTAYEVKVPAGAAALLLTARPESPTATVTLDGQPLPAGGRRIAIGAGGDFNLALEVKAENGAVARYTVRLTRETAPAPASGDLLVEAKNLRLGRRELTALAGRNEKVAAQGQLTVRLYRSNQVLAQLPIAVNAKTEGPNIAITLEQSVGQLASAAGRMVEVETAIPTTGGRYLCYTEALLLEDNARARLRIPFLLLADNPRLGWPALRTPVTVAGYLSQLPPGKSLGGGAELEKNEKGETPVSLEISDARTGALLGQVTARIKPGPGRVFSFESPLELPEGAQVSIRLSARSRGGKIWQVTGTAQVWTTAPDYNGGYEPVLLPLLDELREVNP